MRTHPPQHLLLGAAHRRRRRPAAPRRALRGLAVVVVGLAGLSLAVPAGGQEVAEEPMAEEESFLPEAFLDGYGWFNKAQQTPTGGKPAPNPPSCPSSPASECSVGPPADGLYVVYDYEAVVPGTVTGPVANAPTAPMPPQPPAPAPGVSSTPQPLGPSAYGAVRFVVPEGAESQLSLRILSRSTTQPGGTDPTAGKLFACIVTSTGWLPAQNARYDEGPKYDCTTADEADIQADTAVFDLGQQFVQNGMVDVAIIPAGDAANGSPPFQMAIAAPTDDSLVILNAADLAEEIEPFVEEDFAFEDPAAEFEASLAEEEFAVTEDLSLGGTFAVDDTFGPLSAAPVVRPAPRATRPQVAVPAGNVVNPLGPDASRAERLMAVALLLAIGAGLWWVGGRPTPAPRLLRALGAGQSIPVAAATLDSADPRARGIGRFARVRTTDRPPRLF